MTRTTLTAAAGVAVVGLGLAGISLLPAGAAEADDTTTSEADGSFLADRLARLKEALAGLVDDGTLGQDEADKVAETLNPARRRGWTPPPSSTRSSRRRRTAWTRRSPPATSLRTRPTS
ncbi:hypothetical protein [Georgenia yuyongxinii]